MRHLAAAFLAVLLPFAAWAEMPALTSIRDLLDLMAEDLRQAETGLDFRIDYENERIDVLKDSDENSAIFPHNLFRILKSQESDADRQTAFDSHMSSVVESFTSPKPTLSAADLGRIFPVLRHQSFAEFGATEGNKPNLIAQNTLGDMKTLYAIDSEKSVSYVTADTLKELGLSQEKLAEIAKGNLRLRYEALGVEGDGIYLLVLDGFYESSFVTFDPLWQTVDEQLGTILMAVPARDVVVFADGDNPEAEPALRELITKIIADGTHPLSEELYKWQVGGWVVVD